MSQMVFQAKFEQQQRKHLQRVFETDEGQQPHAAEQARDHAPRRWRVIDQWRHDRRPQSDDEKKIGRARST